MVEELIGHWLKQLFVLQVEVRRVKRLTFPSSLISPQTSHLNVSCSTAAHECSLQIQPHCFNSSLFTMSLSSQHSLSLVLSHGHFPCQANKQLFAFPLKLMLRPGRETKCWEAGGKPVARGYQKGRIDVSWPGETFAGITDGL